MFNYPQASKADYVQHVLPSLKPVMKLMEPIQILLIFMQVHCSGFALLKLLDMYLLLENGAAPGENTT